MRRRPEPDAFPTTPQTAPTDFGLFRQLAAYPVGSQPVPSSEETAALLAATDDLTERRLFVLLRLERGPVSADGLACEVHDMTDRPIADHKDELSPRFSELSDFLLAAQDKRTVWRTSKGRPCHPYQITARGRSALALLRFDVKERAALRYVRSKQRHPEAAP